MKKKPLISMICTVIAIANFNTAMADSQELKALRERIEVLEAKQNNNWTDRMSWSGLVEAEVSTIHADSADSSDITLAKIELALDADVTDNIDIHTLLQHEEGAEEFDVVVDEGFVSYTIIDNLSISAGKMHLPFGNFTSNMISDPLTLEFGETIDSIVQMAFASAGLYSAVYLYNGDVNKIGKEDKINSYGVNLGYSADKNDISYTIGIGYTNNLADSDGFEIGPELQELTAGVSLHAHLGLGGWRLITEYIAAKESFNSTDLVFGTDGAEPKAYNAEIGYAFLMAGKETIAAIGVQGTDEAVALGFVERRVMAALTVAIHESAQIRVEYMTAEDYEVSDGGSGESADTLTFQLNAGF